MCDESHQRAEEGESSAYLMSAGKATLWPVVWSRLVAMRENYLNLKSR
jgi:hypothetical protein